jgi:hypothetical protein
LKAALNFLIHKKTGKILEWLGTTGFLSCTLIYRISCLAGLLLAFFVSFFHFFWQ